MINFKGFVDTTLRDGQESPLLYDTYKYRFTLKEKKQIIGGLIKLGVSCFEFFSPVVNRSERKDFLVLRKFINSLLPKNKKRLLFAHCRCQKEDINQVLDAGFNGLNLYLNLSPYARKYSYGKKLPELVDLVKKTVTSTRKKFPDIYLRYSAEDAFRTTLGDIYAVYDQIYQEVDTFGMPDTTGIATPVDVRRRVRALKKRYPEVNLECHFHNDQGYALINTVTAIESGVEYADTSVWGLAERSGIASITGVLLNLYHLDKAYLKDYHLEFSYPLNVLMGSILKSQVPFTEPVSLTNRTHIAGVHQKAVLNHKKTYEAHDLEKFGVTRKNLLLGSLSGWNFIHYYLKEVENYSLTQDQARVIVQDFKREVVKRKNRKLGPEELLKRIARKYSLIKITIPQQYQSKRLENLNNSH